MIIMYVWYMSVNVDFVMILDIIILMVQYFNYFNGPKILFKFVYLFII